MKTPIKSRAWVIGHEITGGYVYLLRRKPKGASYGFGVSLHDARVWDKPGPARACARYYTKLRVARLRAIRADYANGLISPVNFNSVVNWAPSTSWIAIEIERETNIVILGMDDCVDIEDLI